MATVSPSSEPVNEAERQAIAHLRDRLPASYLILHNFEVPRTETPSRSTSLSSHPMPFILWM